MPTKFQSLIGRLQTSEAWDENTVTWKFQSLIGRLQTWGEPPIRPASPSGFNPS